MELILNSILEEYDKLLLYYEKMYNNFQMADIENIDEFVKIIDKNGKYLDPISGSQQRIEALRRELKKSISNEILIDNMVDDFSDGRVGAISDRIRYIINSIKTFKTKGEVILEQEMKRLENGLEDIGIVNMYNN